MLVLLPRTQLQLCLACLIALCAAPGTARAQSEFEREPIKYATREPADRIHALAAKLRDGSVLPKWDEQHGWLPSLLQALEVPRSSQTLVFSKTSLQFRRINPRRPRALYFSDDVYVGWTHGGDVLELTAVDPEQGAIFYTVDQKRADRPTIRRDRGECLSCHATRRTQGVPGLLVRSVYPQSDGQPDFRLGTLTTDHTTRFKDRFGGWYVTGTHGELRHRGNVFAKGDSRDPIDREAGANHPRLPSRVPVEAYLEPGSDLVALMVLEHQTQMHNRITKASYTARRAIYHQRSMNRILERSEGYRSESTTRRIHAAAEDLVRYMLFCDEYQLSSRVQGSSTFAAEFAATGVRDKKGRSLRDLDLHRRLLLYPCSYLVYSKSFCSLPPVILTRVLKRLREVLSGADRSKEFAHLSNEDRRNILEILSSTHPLFQ